MEENSMKSVHISAVALAASLLATSALADQVIFAHGANPGNPRFVAAEEWGKVYTACTGGKTKVEVAPSATLGDDVELLTSTIGGVIQVTANSQGAVSQIVPEVGLLGLPFLFKDLPSAWKTLDGPVGQMLDERAQKHGLKILGFWDNGIRHVSTLKGSVAKPEDLKGIKIRTPPDQMTIDIFTALGAAPAPLAFSELPTALQSGVFDAQENPLTNIYSSKIYQITKNITLTGHKYESTPVVAGLGWWSGLDKQSQDCALKATADAGKMQRELSLQGDQTLRPKMEAEGVTFTEADHDAYVKATAPVYDKYGKQYPDIVDMLKKSAGQ
jgi:tripartite ATP-independent transporter DctP family solute receptor